jgi:hypothetical protein
MSAAGLPQLLAVNGPLSTPVTALPPASLPALSAALTLLLGNVSASAAAPAAVQAALVSALAGALGCAPDAIAVRGIAGNASVASVGVVLSAESAAAAASLAAALDALVPVPAPAGLAGALALSSPALAGLTFVDAAGDAPPFGGDLSASVDGTLAREAAFVAGFGAFLGVSPGGVRVFGVADAGAGALAVSFRAATPAESAASLQLLLSTSVPSTAASLPALWASLHDAACLSWCW